MQPKTSKAAGAQHHAKAKPNSNQIAKPNSPNKPKTKPTMTVAASSDQDDKKPIFFFKPNEPYGEFCQWYPSTFSASKEDISAIIGHPIDPADPEGWQPIYFHCAEQFMMYCKAGCFGDTETQRQIMAIDDAKEQKRLGRATRGFDAAVWDKIKSDIVELGNMGKFGQNKELRALLLSTGKRPLAEAASLDRVWGIGFTAQEAGMHADQSKWGENRLGKALMAVREKLGGEVVDE